MAQRAAQRRAQAARNEARPYAARPAQAPRTGTYPNQQAQQPAPQYREAPEQQRPMAVRNDAPTGYERPAVPQQTPSSQRVGRRTAYRQQMDETEGKFTASYRPRQDDTQE